MSQYLLAGALVVDGTGGETFVADVLVRGESIVQIQRRTGGASLRDGRSEGVPGSDGLDVLPAIDLSGKMLVPGFIDMHSHSDLVYLGEGGSPVPDAKVRQGITTELLGQDGLGVAPVSPNDRQLLSELTAGLLAGPSGPSWDWASFGEYLSRLEKAHLPTNAAVLASHGPVRIAAMGMESRPPSAAELDRMKALVREAMLDGAFGFSTGLIYPPCSYCDTVELESLAGEAAPYGGIFVVHQRDEGCHLQRSFEEVARVSLLSGAHLHVSHLQAYGKVNWPLMDGVLGRAETLVSSGLRVTWDRYPYLAGCTVLMAVLPQWTLSEGSRALIKNLRDPAFRRRIHADFGKGLDVWNNRAITVGWENIVVSGVRSPGAKWMEGGDCAELASAAGKTPVDFVCDLLADEELAVTMITHYGSPEVLDKVLAHRCATIGTDGIFCGHPHPRLYATYPRFLLDFVIRRKALTWPEAIRKATGLPAEILGLERRGLVREGYFADLAVIDPARLEDSATYDEPARHPGGIDYVFVNGEVVVDPQGFTGRTPGMVLRKGHADGR